MKFAIIPITALLIGLQFNSQPIDTPVSDNSLSVVSSFLNYTNSWELEFPDRTKQISEAKQLDAQRLAEAQEAQRLALIAQQAKNAPQAPQTSPQLAPQSPDSFITALGQCESGNTANRNSGNGYYGAFQFSIATWNAMGTGYARADLAPYEVQVAAVKKLLSRSSVRSQFPGCSGKLGL